MSLGKNRGKNNFKSKLSNDDVIYIFTCTDKTEQELAKKFGISQPAVNHIKRGRTWKWLTDKIASK